MQLPSSADAYQFNTTQWSMVLSAGGPTNDSSTNALGVLCERYYFPVYAYVRNRGYSREDTEDLTQAFFQRLLEKSILAHADPDRGRFRCFLLTAVKNFLHSDYRKQTAQKRGGELTFLSLDYNEAAEQFADLSCDALEPDQLFDREWARTLIDTVISKVRESCNDSQKKALFDALQSHLWSDSDAVPYPTLAEQLGMSLSAVKVNAFRLRSRFRELFEAEIADTVSDEEAVEDEWRHLLRAFN